MIRLATCRPNDACLQERIRPLILIRVLGIARRCSVLP